MKKNLLFLACAGLCVSLVFDSCKKDEDPVETPAPTESVADASTFADWKTWTVNATARGANPGLGPMAHGGQDSIWTRNIYVKDGATLTDGMYAKGTAIVKHSVSDSGKVEITAMVKRGATYNSDNGGWEYFMLDASGAIMKDADGMEMRGSNLMNGMCQNCHGAAKAKDYVFTAK